VLSVRELLLAQREKRLERFLERSAGPLFLFGFGTGIAPVLGGAAEHCGLLACIVEPDVGTPSPRSTRRPLIVTRTAQRFVPWSVTTRRRPAPSS
jgi:hypothetical protein